MNLNHCALAFAALLTSIAFSLASEIETVPDKTSTPLPHHSREEDTALIRKHHLKRLEERMNTDVSELKRTCRFESDISTRPPAGKVALTFDDGPEEGQTEEILATLKKYNIPATFFVIGRNVEAHPQLLELELAAGHTVAGNHSWDHPNFHEISVEQQAEEVKRDDVILNGKMHAKFFRYPYGNSSCETNELVHSMGYKIVGWHIDSCDWAFDKNGKIDAKEALTCGVGPQYHEDFVGHVVSSIRARNGGILLMHEIHPNTIKKLDEIVGKLLADGFKFTDLNDPDFQTSLR